MENKFFKDLPIWFINLDKSGDRLERMIDSLNQCGISNYERVEAVDGVSVDLSTPKADHHLKELTSGEMGANLSYIKLLNKFLDSDLEYVLMCDDDVDFSNSVKLDFSFIDTLKYHNPEFYCLKMNSLDLANWFNNDDTVPVNKLVKARFTSLGNATIVNRKWAEQFLNRYQVRGISTENIDRTFIHKYTSNINNNPRHVIPACDVITIDEHTYVWRIFGVFDFESTLTPDFFTDLDKVVQRKSILASYNEAINSYDWDTNASLEVFSQSNTKLNRVIVTPAGRKKFLKILYKNVLKNRADFDKWVLWANTNNEDDLKYIRELSATNDFIEHVELDVPFEGNGSIPSFFKHCVDVDTMYLRLDDDICYIHDNAIKEIFDYREQHPKPFLVFGNIVNNGRVNEIHLRNGSYPSELGIRVYDAIRYAGVDMADSAINLHKFFIDKHQAGSVGDLLFEDGSLIHRYERVSINAIAWMGADFAKFNGVPDFTGQRHPFETDEEEFLSCKMPVSQGRPNEVCGTALFVHFSFGPHLDRIQNEAPEIYQFYEKLE